MSTQKYLAAINQPLSEEINQRALIGLFFLVYWMGGYFVLTPIQDGVTYGVAASLLEICFLVILPLYLGKKAVANDINELNMYSLLCHLVYLPLYVQGVSEVYHNFIINYVINGLALARLCYFGRQTADGDYPGLPVFGLLGLMRRYWPRLQALYRPLQNIHPSNWLFFSSAPLLWFIMLRTNDQTITTAVVIVMVFIFVIGRRIDAQLARQQQMINRLIALVPAQLLAEAGLAVTLPPQAPTEKQTEKPTETQAVGTVAVETPPAPAAAKHDPERLLIDQANPYQNPYFDSPKQLLAGLHNCLELLPRTSVIAPSQLNHDQRLQAQAITYYADAKREIIATGVNEIAGLLKTQPNLANYPHTKRLIEHLHADLSWFSGIADEYEHIPAPKRKFNPGGAKPLSMREVAAQVLDAYQTMQPFAQNLSLAFTKHLARCFPLETGQSILPGSPAALRYSLLKQIEEMRRLAQLQYALRDRIDHDTSDNRRLRAVFDACFSETPKSGKLFGVIDLLDSITDPEQMPDASFALLCDALLQEWICLLLDYGPNYEYMANYQELHELTLAFFDKYSPLEE